MGKYVLVYNDGRNSHGTVVADKLPQLTKYLREFTYCPNGNRIRTYLIEDGLYLATRPARSGIGSFTYTIRYDRNK